MYVAAALTVVHPASGNVNCLHMYSTIGFLCFRNSADFIWSSLSDSMLAKYEFVAYTEKCATNLYLCAENNWRGMPHENQKQSFFCTLRGLSPRANYTDRAAAASRRS